MSYPPVTDKWPEMRSLAEQGIPLIDLARDYKVNYNTVKKRAHREEWLTFDRMTAKIEAMSAKGTRAAGQEGEPPEKSGGDDDKLSLLVSNWDERASYVRQLAWKIGEKSIKPLVKTGIAIKDAGDLAKTVKLMREATGLFQDQSAVQVSIFGGAAAGFDGKTVDIETEIVEAPADYEEEM